VAAALAAAVVALGGAVAVAIAGAAGFGRPDGVAVVPGLAPFTIVAKGVAEAALTNAGDAVAGRRVGGVNVAVAKAGLAITTCKKNMYKC
jgi:hypothetical protein